MGFYTSKRGSFFLFVWRPRYDVLGEPRCVCQQSLFSPQITRSRAQTLEGLKGTCKYSAGLVDSFGKKIVGDDQHLICPHRAPISPEVLRKTLRGDPADVDNRENSF